MFPLHQVRQDTPACEQVIHLNNAGASLPPQVVTVAMQNYLAEEAIRGGYETAEAYTEQMNQFYELVARLLRTHSRNIAFVANATDAYAKVLAAIPFQENDVILTSRDDYVSNQLAFLQLMERTGVRLLRIPNSTEGTIDLMAAEELIRQHRPKLVALTHVPTSSGLIQPVKALGDLCRQYDCWYLVDACQSAGQLPLYVEEIKCDFLCTSYRKFLRGPRGAGFLYVSDAALEQSLSPLGIDLRGAVWNEPNQYQLLPNAKRFEYWERSYALVLGSVKATEYLLDLGVEAVAQRLQTIGNYTRQQLRGKKKIRLLDRGAHQANIITFATPEVSQAEITQALKTHHINFSFTGKAMALLDFTDKEVDWAVRISPHYYNTEQEIDRLMAALDTI